MTKFVNLKTKRRRVIVESHRQQYDYSQRVNFQVHPQEKLGNFKKYARENVYEVMVEFDDGTVITLQAIRNSPIGESEYATAWDIRIPLMPGKTVITGWPSPTGAGGYIERRKTIIYNEPPPRD